MVLQSALDTSDAGERGLKEGPPRPSPLSPVPSTTNAYSSVYFLLVLFLCVNVYVRFISSLGKKPFHFFVNGFGRIRTGEFISIYTTQGNSFAFWRDLGRARVKAAVCF